MQQYQSPITNTFIDKFYKFKQCNVVYLRKPLIDLLFKIINKHKIPLLGFHINL